MCCLRSCDITLNSCDGMDLLQIPSLAEQSRLVVLLTANNAGSAVSSDVHSGEEDVSDRGIAEEADEENWDLKGVKTAAEPN